MTQTLDQIIAIGAGACVVIAVLLVVASLLTKKFSPPGWAKVALWITCCTVILLPVMDIIENRLPDSSLLKHALNRIWFLLAGFLTGAAFVLFLSRALSIKRKEPTAFP